MQGEQAQTPRWRWLLGDDPVQRLRLSQAGLASLLMTACTGIMVYAATDDL